jgi:hypothetical protein
MKSEMRCGDPAALAGYLYDEIDSAERDAVERHLAGCEICTSEVEGLQGTRAHLEAWTPPDVSLGFRITSDAAESPFVEAPRARAVVLTSPKWQWPAVPAWAQAAAAVMLFAGGALLAALMNVEVRYDQAGMTIRTGWQQTGPASPAQNISARDLASLESRIRAEFMQTRSDRSDATSASAPSRAESTGEQSGGTLASADVLQRVRQIVAESEQRQQRELALRLTQAVRELDTTHRADLERIERTVSPMEEQQRQMLNYITRVSQPR